MKSAPTPCTIVIPDFYGAPFEGGFYGGQIRVGAAILAVAWAPKEHGETNAAWLQNDALIDCADSPCDSVANTLSMAQAGSPLALWAHGLTINGHADWCIPARDVLEMGYRHLKPTAYENSCSYRDGENPYSVPPGWLYTESNPTRTQAEAFRSGGEQAFNDSWYWTSTQFGANTAFGQHFVNGSQSSHGKSYESRARAVRLIQLNT